MARRGSAVQHDRAPRVPDVRPGPERPDQRRGPLAQRSAARVSRDVGCAPALEGHPDRGKPADLQRQALGRDRQVTLPQGSRRILLEPRGSRRLSSQALLDLRVSKTLPVGSAGRVDLILDVLNVLGDNAEEALVSDNLVAATFGTPQLFIDPRRAMLGVRLNLGR